MKKYFIMLLFWPIFWILYSILFSVGFNILLWLFGILPFDRAWIFLILHAEAVKLILWVIGGILGGIIGAAISSIEWKFRWTLDALFWMFFWLFFLSMAAAVFWLKNSTLFITGPGLRSTNSQMPIIIFGALGGAVGGLINQVIDERFFKKRKTE